MNWRWQYESQGYELDEGDCYLPDFEITLPDGVEWFVEVKPENFDKFDHHKYILKLQRFTGEAQKDLIVLDGNPSCKPFDIICHRFTQGSLGMGLLQDYAPFIRWCDGYWFSAISIHEKTGRAAIDLDERGMRKSFGKLYLESIKAAMGEKFGI